MNRNIIHFMTVTATTAMLSGCVSFEPIRLYGPEPAVGGSMTVLWSRSIYVKNLFERPNKSIVTRVDGVALDENKTLSGAPIELLPGRHVVEVRYDRALPLPVLFFDLVFVKQSTKSIEAVLEAGHSYMPFTRKHCDKDWFWIVDTGRSPETDVDSWKKSISYHLFSYQVRSAVSKQLLIVGGEMPPERCDEQLE